MNTPAGRKHAYTTVVALLLGSAGSAAYADPLTIPGYTVTDLGPGAAFSSDSRGNGVLSSPSGQVYAFSQMPSTVLTPGQGIMAGFPILISAPESATYGNPSSAFATIQSAVMNANGVVVATEVYGVAGHWAGSTAYAAQYNANGTWGSAVPLWTGNQVFLLSNSVPAANLVTGVNSLNQVLGSVGVDTSRGINTDAILYNVHAHSSTDLSQLFYTAEAAGWPITYNDFRPVALDDSGQIVLSASRFAQSGFGTETDLLLTPDGPSPAPLEVPAPEPGSLAVLVMAMAGFAAQRLRQRPRGS